MDKLSHFNEAGLARMVDVGGKEATERRAVAVGRVRLNRETFQLVKEGRAAKGDVIGTAQIAGIMGAKKTWEMIPMCHPIPLSGIDLRFTLCEDDCTVEIQGEVACKGYTGVEMEALTAVSTAALTIYDMCKAVQKDILIQDIHLLTKTGGKSGDFRWEDRHEV